MVKGLFCTIHWSLRTQGMGSFVVSYGLSGGLFVRGNLGHHGSPEYWPDQNERRTVVRDGVGNQGDDEGTVVWGKQRRLSDDDSESVTGSKCSIDPPPGTRTLFPPTVLIS